MILAEGEEEAEEGDTGEPEEEGKDETTVDDTEGNNTVKLDHIKETQRICMDMFSSATMNLGIQDSLRRH